MPNPITQILIAALMKARFAIPSANMYSAEAKRISREIGEVVKGRMPKKKILCDYEINKIIEEVFFK